MEENTWLFRSKKYKARAFNALNRLLAGEEANDMRSLPSYPIHYPVAKEDVEQIRAATWLTKNDIPFYHIPNGGRRTMREGVKFKRIGHSGGRTRYLPTGSAIVLPWALY